jgi:hypothetical protein
VTSTSFSSDIPTLSSLDVAFLASFLDALTLADFLPSYKKTGRQRGLKLDTYPVEMALGLFPNFYSPPLVKSSETPGGKDQKIPYVFGPTGVFHCFSY